MNLMPAIKILAASAGLAAMLASPAADADDRLQQAVTSDTRTPLMLARNPYRNPVETLTFFGIEPDMTVVELSPGGGWYTSILGPYLAGQGQLIAAHVDLESEATPDFYRDIYAEFEQVIADPARFATTEVIAFDPPRKTSLGEPGSADLVVSFRNVHGWQRDGIFGDVLDAVRTVLKPGGVFGIVQHRLPEERDGSEYTGYVKQSWVVAKAESHGFRLVEASEINANPKDTADHPEGVWSLPPSLRNVPREQRPEFFRIGESDRMTLKFVKR